jgi:hypothetical protein
MPAGSSSLSLFTFGGRTRPDGLIYNTERPRSAVAQLGAKGAARLARLIYTKLDDRVKPCLPSIRPTRRRQVECVHTTTIAATQNADPFILAPFEYRARLIVLPARTCRSDLAGGKTDGYETCLSWLPWTDNSQDTSTYYE